VNFVYLTGQAWKQAIFIVAKEVLFIQMKMLYQLSLLNLEFKYVINRMIMPFNIKSKKLSLILDTIVVLVSEKILRIS